MMLRRLSAAVMGAIAWIELCKFSVQHCQPLVLSCIAFAVRWRRSLLRILLLYLGSLKMKNSLACSRMCNCVKLSSVAYKIQELMTSDFKLYFLVLLLCFTWCAVRSCTPPVISFWWLFLDIIFCRGLSCLY